MVSMQTFAKEGRQQTDVFSRPVIHSAHPQYNVPISFVVFDSLRICGHPTLFRKSSFFLYRNGRSRRTLLPGGHTEKLTPTHQRPRHTPAPGYRQRPYIDIDVKSLPLYWSSPHKHHYGPSDRHHGHKGEIPSGNCLPTGFYELRNRLFGRTECPPRTDFSATAFAA